MPVEESGDNALKLPSVELYEGSHQTPDPEYIRSFMQCIVSDIDPPTDLRRDMEGLDIEIWEGRVFRYPALFYPPQKVWLNGDSITKSQEYFWQTFADLLLWRTQKKAYTRGNIASLNNKYDKLGIRNVHINYSLGAQENLYFDVDTSKSRDRGMDVSAEVDRLKQEVKQIIEATLISVLSDHTIVDRAITSATVGTRIKIATLFEDIISRIDSIRFMVENSDDTKRAYAMLNNVVRLLGSQAGGDCADPDYDLDVIPLSSHDAVVRGCIGLYKPEHVGKSKAQVCIPRSIYGTTSLRSINDMLDILAHELGHHLSIKKPLTDRPSGGISDHDLQHSYWEHHIRQQLHNMHFKWDDSRVIMGPDHSTETGMVEVPKVGGWRGMLIRLIGG